MKNSTSTAAIEIVVANFQVFFKGVKKDFKKTQDFFLFDNSETISCQNM